MTTERSDDGGRDGRRGLTDDNVFEILTHVSLDDLASCRQVSGWCRRLTYEPAFKPLHCRRTDTASGYFVQSTKRCRYSTTFVSMHPVPATSPPLSLAFLPFKNVRIEAVAAHRGLMCCVDADNACRKKPCYYVCKPSTRQWRALPNPTLRFRTMATAMVARPSAAAEFKIVRLSESTLMDCLRIEIFDSRRWAWRRSADVAVSPTTLYATVPAVTAHGAMHWLRRPGGRGEKADIFAFDMKNETWRLIKLPPEVESREWWVHKTLVAMEGRLCMVVHEEQEVEVWAMANYAQGCWEKKKVVSLKSLRSRVTLEDFYSSDVVFLSDYGIVMWYDFLRGKMTEVEVDHGKLDVFKYESDLVPCELHYKKQELYEPSN